MITLHIHHVCQSVLGTAIAINQVDAARRRERK